MNASRASFLLTLLLICVPLCLVLQGQSAADGVIEIATGPEDLLKLEQQGKITVRALRGFGRLPDHFLKLAQTLRNEKGLDLLGADLEQIRQWRVEPHLADVADQLAELTAFMEQGKYLDWTPVPEGVSISAGSFVRSAGVRWIQTAEGPGRVPDVQPADDSLLSAPIPALPPIQEVQIARFAPAEIFRAPSLDPETPLPATTDLFWASLPETDLIALEAQLAGAPEGFDFGSLDVVDYRAAVVQVMEALRQVYGPLTPEEEERFGKKWQPYLEWPTLEVLDYLQRLTPALHEFLAVRAAVTESGVDLQALLEEAALAEIHGEISLLDDIMATVGWQRDLLLSLGARLQATAQKIMDIGDPPDPLSSAAQTRRRHRKALEASAGLIAAQTAPADATGEQGEGTFVLIDHWLHTSKATNPNYAVSVHATHGAAQTSSQFIGMKDAPIEKYEYSWTLPQPKIPLGGDLEVTLGVTGWVEGAEPYFHGQIYLIRYTTQIKAEDVPTYIAEVRKQHDIFAWGQFGTALPLQPAASIVAQSSSPVGTAKTTVKDSFSWVSTDPKASPHIYTGEYILLVLIEVNAFNSSGTAKAFYLYQFDPSGTLEPLNIDETESASAFETDPQNEQRAFHQANIHYFTTRLAELHKQLGATRDPEAQKHIQWQILATESTLQGERDALTRLDTGEWVRTRTRFDDLCFMQAARHSAEQSARWAEVRRRIDGSYRLLRLAPESEREQLRDFINKQISSDLIARGDPAELRRITEAVANRVQGYWEGVGAREMEREAEQTLNIALAEAIRTGATAGVSIGLAGQAIRFGATLAQAEWIGAGAGALYGGVTGYVEGGPREAVRQAANAFGPLLTAAEEAWRGYEEARKRGEDWLSATKTGLQEAAPSLLLAKAAQFGIQGLSRWLGGPKPTVKQQFEAARYRQQMEWDRALIDHFQRKQWQLAQAVSTGKPISAVESLHREIRGLTASINASYGAKWLLKHKGSPLAQVAFNQSIGELQQEVLPEIMRQLQGMGYDTSRIQFRSFRNASSVGSVGMDWDLGLADETAAILREVRLPGQPAAQQPVGLAAFLADAQKAMDSAYYARTGMSARTSSITVTGSVHPEAYWDPQWLARVKDFSHLDPRRLDQAKFVSTYKAAHIAHDPSLNAIQRTQETCRGAAKDLDTKLLPYLDHKIQTAAGDQALRLRELREHWRHVRDHLHTTGNQESDPYTIIREMNRLQTLTGTDSAFDVVNNMATLWEGLDKLTPR